MNNVFKMKKKRAFTLIELMIAIAILAIIFASQIPVNKVFNLFARRNINNASAINAHRYFLNLKSSDKYPPETLVVPNDLKIKLNNDFYKDSLCVYFNGKLIPKNQIKLNPGNNTITIDPKYRGQNIVMNYKMPLNEWNEIKRIPSEKPYKIYLSNTPVFKINNVKLANGNALLDLDKSNFVFNKNESAIEFNEYPGKCVSITYSTGGFESFITGAFTDSDMINETFIPSDFKVIKIKYGGEKEKECLTFFTIKRV